MLPADGLNVKSDGARNLKRSVETALARAECLPFFVHEINEDVKFCYSITTDQISLFYEKEPDDKLRCVNCRHVFVKEKKLRYFEHLRRDLIAIEMSVVKFQAPKFVSKSVDNLKDRIRERFERAYRVFGEDETILPSGHRKLNQQETDWIPFLPGTTLMQIFNKHRKSSANDGFFKVEFSKQLKKEFVWNDSDLKKITLRKTTGQKTRRLKPNELNDGEKDGDHLFVVNHIKQVFKKERTVHDLFEVNKATNEKKGWGNLTVSGLVKSANPCFRTVIEMCRATTNSISYGINLDPGLLQLGDRFGPFKATQIRSDPLNHLGSLVLEHLGFNVPSVYVGMYQSAIDK